LRILKGKFSILASIRMAVFIILSMAVIAAVGTITEARFDAEVAQKLVYQSIYMYIVMGLLCVNLIAVMVDRWPWKQHHMGFVLAHIGIITLLFGAWLTQHYGVDGTLAFETGQKRNTVSIKDREILVYSSMDGNNFTGLYQGNDDFLRHPPSEKDPFIIHIGKDDLRIFQYEHFAFRESEISPTDKPWDGAAVRFQLENPNVNMTQWLRREGRFRQAEIDLGPAKVILTSSLPPPSGRNEVVLVETPGHEELDYVIYNKDNSIRKKGQVRQSETVETGWMGMKFRLLRYLPHAMEKVTYVPSPTASPISISAFRFTFQGGEYWLGLDSVVRVFTDSAVYLISYGHRRLELAFPLTLKQFKVGMYQGTDRASSYESLVEVPGRGDVTISMNEPLKHDGYTFYQSSFEKNERGEPVASILSVNKDPGRWIKYIGSMLIVLGSIVLFYFKRVKWVKTPGSKT